MKKIKLVLSDMHLGRGRTLPGGITNSFEEFYYDEQFAEFLNYYTTGEFSDAEVELIINGDIFNFLQVDYNGHYLTVLTESICHSNLKTIIDGHPIFFNALKAFAIDPKHKVTYIIGNHDQPMLWPACQHHLNEVLGAPVRYRSIIYFFDGVHIEHGNMHEAANRLDPKKFFLKKDLAEPILNLPFGSHFFIDFVLKIKQIRPYVDKVRPFKAFIRWGLVHDTWFALKTLSKLAAFFVRTIMTRDARHPWSPRRIVEIVKESAVFPELEHSAEKILYDDRVHTVIFGHTHVYMYKQFGPNKEYFNTGTWTELTSLDITSLGKITKLTYVLLEYAESAMDVPPRPRARLKEWRGYHRIEKDVDVS
ncbi:MAG: metallophosphoesterase [Bdellovibrionia bacterium]